MNIEIDGLNISYKESGQGDQVIVMLQGWGTDLGMYDSIADCLNDKYRFIQFDFPGFGASDEPKEPWNVDAYTDFFCKFMEAVGIKKASLIGHSYGGRVIIKLASRDTIPFEIDKIVLLDAAGIVPEKSLMQKFKIKRYKFLKKIAMNKVVYYLFPELIDDWRSRQGSADYKAASPMMRQCMVMAVNEDLRHLLPKIKQDTLLVWGDVDTATPISDARLMDSLIPNSGLAIIEGAGHYAYLEKPAIFRNIVRAYFQIGASN